MEICHLKIGNFALILSEVLWIFKVIEYTQAREDTVNYILPLFIIMGVNSYKKATYTRDVRNELLISIRRLQISS